MIPITDYIDSFKKFNFIELLNRNTCVRKTKAYIRIWYQNYCRCNSDTLIDVLTTLPQTYLQLWLAVLELVNTNAVSKCCNLPY